jgi:DNA-binding SARP family transcriptional activator/predicted ATPase
VVTLSVRLLGTPEVEAGGARLALNNQKAHALLYYLAATAQPHTRDHLAALLWSESPTEQARHALRSALYRLRQALRPSGADACLVETANQLSLAFDGRVECDVVKLRQLSSDGGERALAELVNSYRGSLLQGFNLPGAAEFEDWRQLEDARLGQVYAGALGRLASWAEARDDWPAAIGHLQALARHDPLDEATQQHLIKLHVRTGATGPALRQYQRFARELKAELGLEPVAETRALYQDALRLQRPAAPAEGDTGWSARTAHRLPFVGREAPLGRLLVLAREAQAGHGLSVLAQGEGGIGKSRLLDELAASLAGAAPPWLVLAGACSPFDDLLSYGPFLEALGRQSDRDLDALLRESGQGAPDARGRFFWRVLEIVRDLSRTAPVLLALEDLQWANSSTLNLFGFLAMRLRALPVLMIGTVQNAESIPALRRLLTLGRRRGDLHLLPLPPLSLEAVAGLVQGADTNPAAVAALGEWLHDRSGGNPFLLTEMLAQMQAQAVLGQDGARWRLDTTRWLRWRATFTLPETTHDLVAWRLSDLAAPARQVLDALAVAGQPLPIDLLSQLSGLSREQLTDTLDHLLARGLVREPRPDAIGLPHHLLRETLLRRLSSLRRRAIHRQLAQLFDAAGLPARQIALHAVAGEDVELARRYGLQVLADLPQNYTGAETVDFLHHLHDLLAPSAAPDELLRLAQALGRLHQALGQLEAAATWQARALQLAQQLGDAPAEADARFEMAELALVSNAYQAAASAAEAGLQLMQTDQLADAEPSLMGRGNRLLGAALAMEGSDLAGAERHLLAAVAAHRLAQRPGDLCAALFELGNVAAQRGQLARALDLYEESAQAAEAGRVYYYLALAHNNFAYHSLLLGRPGPALEAAAQGLKLAETYEMLAVLSFLYSTQGEIHLYLAEWPAAAEAFQRGYALAEELGNLERQAGYRAGLALAARGQGNFETALAYLDEALALIGGQGYWHLQTRLLLWQVETSLMRGYDAVAGDVAAASGPLDAAAATAAATAASHGHVLLLIQAERLQAQLLARAGDWPGADALFARAAERAGGLDLSFEAARTRAAWAAAAMHHAPEPGRARHAELLRQAQALLDQYNARGDLANQALLYAPVAGVTLR